jgi:hypothetical protein
MGSDGMQTWSPSRPSLAVRFWSLAEQAERGVTADRSGPVGVVRHILDILAELEAGRSGTDVAPTTTAFLAELATREMHGDYAYLAPEREPGDPLGDRALVYSVGVLLLEGLTGRHPFGSVEGPRRLGGMPGEALATLIATAPEVPPALRGVLGRATSLDPGQRFASVVALAAELEWFMVTEEQGALPLPPRAAPMPLPRVPLVPLPPVVIDPRAMVPNRIPSIEMQLETALVPRLVYDELMPKKRKPARVRPAERTGPRRSHPSRRRRREVVRMAVLATLLMLGSAAATAVLMYLLQR